MYGKQNAYFFAINQINDWKILFLMFGLPIIFISSAILISQHRKNKS